MSRIGDRSGNPEPLQRHLLAEADRQGNADGVASSQELQHLVGTLDSAPAYDVSAQDRRSRAQQLLGQSGPGALSTLSPALQAMPQPLRQLALELDGLWGNADGSISVDEFDRVVQFSLAALPFFADKAEALLELAQHLGFDQTDHGASASVLQLQMALAHVDQNEVEEARPFRELFDEAVALGEQPGAPELLRDALQHSPRWHRFSILDHTAKAVHSVRELAQTAGMEWKEAGATLLLHDVGKIIDRHLKHQSDTDDNPRYHYFDHEAVGAQWLEERGLSPDIGFHVRHHADIRKRPVSEIVELAGNKERLAEMVVVYIADQVAKGDTPSQLQSFADLEPKLLELAARAGLDGPALLERAHTLRQDLL